MLSILFFKHFMYCLFQRLLFAHKQQMESQVKMTQAAHSEHDRLKRDIVDYTKQSAELTGRIDIIQSEHKFAMFKERYHGKAPWAVSNGC